ncbi:MAG: glycosyltransferase [Myxococcota bacterium]|nr:glycosyltransferase [Myxococcota bacterium]
MSSTALVHLAIPIRNVETWLDAALKSLHLQSEARWTATIVDDDSDDDSPAIAQAWVDRDPRMRFQQPGRVGLPAALNLAAADRHDAPFFARFDGDDICHPRRLEKQLAFFSKNPEVEVLDSRFSLQDGGPPPNQGMKRYQRWHDSIETNEDFEREFLVENPVCHPASMVRASALERLDSGPSAPYRDGDFPEDYDLWLRLKRQGARFHKLPERLVLWRDRPDRTTRRNPAYRKEAFFQLKWDHIQQSQLVTGRRTAVWGAKKGGKPWIRALCQHGAPPVAVVDIDPKAVGGLRHGVPVISPEDLPAHSPEVVLVAVGAPGARSLIEKQLDKMMLPSIPLTGLC